MQLEKILYWAAIPEMYPSSCDLWDFFLELCISLRFIHWFAPHSLISIYLRVSSISLNGGCFSVTGSLSDRKDIHFYLHLFFSGFWGSALPPNLQNILWKVDEGEK